MAGRGKRGRRNSAARPERRERDRAGKRSRRSILLPRTAPLFDGVPEPGAGKSADEDGGFLGLNAIAPRDVAIGAARAVTGGGTQSAVLVPALVAVVGGALAAAALIRRRRLASRAGGH